MINGKKVLAFIPAKTGSVGLPGKLFKKIGHYSLLEWTLFAAYQSNYIDEIVVSSNDLEIKKVTEEFAKGHNNKAKITFVERPDKYCTPTSKTEDALFHLFDVDKSIIQEYYYLMILQSTSPIRRSDLIDNSIELLNNSNKNSLLTVSCHTPFFFRQNKTETEVLFDAKNRKMRQEIQKHEFMFHDDGCLYISKIDTFLKEKCRFDLNPILVYNDKLSSLQIDDSYDFFIIQKIIEEYRDSNDYIHNIHFK